MANLLNFDNFNIVLKEPHPFQLARSPYLDPLCLCVFVANIFGSGWSGSGFTEKDPRNIVIENIDHQQYQ
jgi:hypothetical protein